VHPLLLVEAHQYPAAENGVVHIGKDVASLGETAEFLDRLLEWVLPTQGLQLGNDKRWSHEPVMHRCGHPVDVVPVLGDDLVADAAAEHWGQGSVAGAPLGPVDDLVR
jgi:hypothetical protein